MDNSYSPLIFDISIDAQKKEFDHLMHEKKPVLKDSLREQLCELIKNQKPDQVFTNDQLLAMSKQKVSLSEEYIYGVWVYYPWSNIFVHTLPKEEFVFLRTVRNKHKITEEEQKQLSTKKVGVIGLSVGQSVSLTMSMERSYGELRIADFDTLELSNLNRIRAGIENLGLPKCVLVAREIAEIDPFLEIKCFHEGINDDNIDEFIGTGDNQLDILIDECDSLDIKIKSRIKAKEKRIPVLMDTSDRGMLDVERFDIEFDRDILHGIINDEIDDFIKNANNQNFFEMAMKILDQENISERMKYSISQIGESITSWPQLASAVVLGGGITAEVYRKIMLGDKVSSGRYYIDFDDFLPLNKSK